MSITRILQRKIRLSKPVDTISEVLFLRAYFWTFSITVLPCVFFVGLLGVPLAAVLSAVISIWTTWVADRIGSGCSNLLYGLGNSNRSQRDRLLGDLSRARWAKMQEDYKTALTIVNQILLQDGTFAEASFLKAQILWEGFGNVAAASRCLKRVILEVPDPNEPLHRWALFLLAKIVAGASNSDSAFN